MEMLKLGGAFFLLGLFLVFGPLYMRGRQNNLFKTGEVEDYVDYEAQTRGTKLFMIGGFTFLAASVYFFLQFFLK